MAQERPPRTVEFHYIKSNGFRVVHTDGAWGGPTPHGYIAVTFYSERAPLPQLLVRELDSSGRLGKEVSRKSRNGYVREAEVQVMMDLRVAEGFVEWLQNKISAVQNRSIGDNGGQQR